MLDCYSTELQYYCICKDVYARVAVMAVMLMALAAGAAQQRNLGGERSNFQLRSIKHIRFMDNHFDAYMIGIPSSNAYRQQLSCTRIELLVELRAIEVAERIFGYSIYTTLQVKEVD